MQRIIKGIDESISYEEAKTYSEKARDELLMNVVSVIDETILDEEEAAVAKTRLATLIGRMQNADVMKGLLMDPDDYVASVFPKGSKVEVVNEEC